MVVGDPYKVSRTILAAVMLLFCFFFFLILGPSVDGELWDTSQHIYSSTHWRTYRTIVITDSIAIMNKGGKVRIGAS